MNTGEVYINKGYSGDIESLRVHSQAVIITDIKEDGRKVTAVDTSADLRGSMPYQLFVAPQDGIFKTQEQFLAQYQLASPEELAASIQACGRHKNNLTRVVLFMERSQQATSQPSLTLDEIDKSLAKHLSPPKGFCPHEEHR